MMRRLFHFAGIFSIFLLSGCGLYTPSAEHDESLPNIADADLSHSAGNAEARFEANLVGNIRCELQFALLRASALKSLPYLSTTWGTQITLKLTWDENAALSPNAAFIKILPATQTFALNFGGAGTSHSTRLETISFIYENRYLYADATRDIRQNIPDCKSRETGIQIESDLKIGEFIFNKAWLAQAQVANNSNSQYQEFATFQDDLTFVASLNANISPVWKLTKFTGDSSGNLASATRTVTGDVLITLGPLAKDNKGNLLPTLTSLAAIQQAAGAVGGSVASQVNSQSR